MCMCGECFFKKYLNFAEKSVFFENKEVVSHGNYDKYINFSTSLCAIYLKLHICKVILLYHINSSVSILKFQNGHFEKIAFKVNIIILIAWLVRHRKM